MYDLRGHVGMIRDRTRVGAYEKAIRATVRPGDRVLDLGAGVGLLTLLALRYGAAHVYAVERSEAVELARRVIREHGYEERATCIRGDGREVELTERVDLIVADLRGALPLQGDSLETLIEARDRHLKPAGKIIPRKDEIFLAPVEHPKGFAAVSGWKGPIAGQDYSSLAFLAANQWCNQPFAAEDPLARGLPLATLDFRELGHQGIRMEAAFEIERRGRLHGLGAWFDSELAPGVVLSTAPWKPPTVYGQAFFPAFDEHAVEPGDRVEARLEARHTGPEHVWLWELRIERQGREPVEERHASFHGEIVEAGELRKKSDAHTPSLTEGGRIDRLILDRMDGEASVGEIAREVQRVFPQAFTTWAEALARVGELSAKYSS